MNCKLIAFVNLNDIPIQFFERACSNLYGITYEKSIFKSIYLIYHIIYLKTLNAMKKTLNLISKKWFPFNEQDHWKHRILFILIGLPVLEISLLRKEKDNFWSFAIFPLARLTDSSLQSSHNTIGRLDLT